VVTIVSWMEVGFEGLSSEVVVTIVCG
jgi:hypothetical protein